MMRFWQELRRRNVVRVAGVYGVIAWLLIEVSSVIEPALGLPDWFDAMVIAVLAIGFPVALVIAWAFELTPEGIRRSTSVAGEPVRGGNVADLAILGALVLLVGISVFRSRPGAATLPGDGRPGLAEAGAGSVAGSEIPSIAVLPFVNLSSDPEQEFFSDGLSEELLSHLAQIDDLRVTGRTSSFAFKGSQLDLPTIGERLGVRNILEGSVRRAGNELRIDARLVNASDGVELWAETFDRQLDDVFAIQEEIAVAVADALSIALSVGSGGLDRLGTDSFDAYEHYLRGQSIYYRAGLYADALREAYAEYERALEMDPDFAGAWIGLGNTSVNLALAAPEWRAQSGQDVNDAAARLAELAPGAWETHVFEAYRLQERWDWAGAQRAFDEAASLSPTDASVWADSYGSFLNSVGRVEEGVGVYQEAREYDPLSLYLSGLLALYLDASGDRQGATDEYERSLRLDGPRGSHEVQRLQRALDDGSPTLVDAQFTRILEGGAESGLPPAYLAFIVRLRPVWDSPPEAVAVVRDYFDELRAANASSQALLTPATFAAHYGDVDLALEVMDEAYIVRRRMFLGPLWMTPLAPVRADPRFKDLVRELGLVEYWQETGEWGDYCSPVGSDDFVCR